MQSPTKLIKEIRGAIASEETNAPFETFAAEYVRLCNEAAQRLDSCTAMLTKGSEYQALQLAETEPELLELIATLSFAEAPEWADLCVSNQLPVAPKFDSKAVQALDQLYAKGITVNHPLYKDYRGAVTSRDDAKALQIIRSIVRLNPGDANAKAELVRIENKLFQIKLQELRGFLAQQDETGILSALSEMERLATENRLSELPEYARAVQVRREVAKREAMSTAARLMDSLEEEHRGDSWRMVGDILARLRDLQAEHGFALGGKEAAQCVEMQRYFDGQRAASDEKVHFEHAMASLGGLAESFEARLLTRASLTSAEAQSLLGEFNRRWKEVEKFQRPVPENYTQRVRKSAGALSAELDRLQRQRRIKLIVVCGATAAVLAVVAWFTIRALHASDYVNQLARLQQAGQVEAAEKMVAQVRKDEPGLAAKPKLTARLDETDRWTRDQRAKLLDVEGKLVETEAIIKTGMEAVDPMVLVTQIESTNQLIESLASGLRTAPAGRMLVVRNQFDAHISVLREKLTAKAEEDLTVMENMAGSKLVYDQSKEVVSEALAQVEPILKSLEARIKPAVTALELPTSHQARVSALRNRVDLFRGELAVLDKVWEVVLQANTLDAYLQALGGYKASRLTQAREVSDARKLLATPPKPDDLLASLLLPGASGGWARAKTDATKGLLAPDNVLAGEMSQLMALRNDIYLNDIWEFTFIDLSKKGVHRDLFSRGELKKSVDIETTTWQGSVCDPFRKTDPPVFMPNTSYTMRRTGGDGGFAVNGNGEVKALHLSAVSQSLTGFELNRMTDATGSKFEKPLLGVFNDLVNNKTAPPLFKAYIMQSLALVLNIRPYDWGLEYSASLRKDLADFNKLCDGVLFRSQDWLLEWKKDKFGRKFAAFFASLDHRDYLTEARIHREVVRGVIKAGLQFGGFVDCEGKPHLLGEARGAKILWSLAEDTRSLVRYVPPDETQGSAKINLVGFSPIFFVPLDRDAFLAEVFRRFAVKPDAKTDMSTIPWLAKP